MQPRRTADLRVMPENVPSQQQLPGSGDEHPQLDVWVRGVGGGLGTGTGNVTDRQEETRKKNMGEMKSDHEGIQRDVT